MARNDEHAVYDPPFNKSKRSTMKHQFNFQIGVAAIVLLFLDPANGQVPMTVKRYQSVSLTDVRVDEILSSARELLDKVDGNDDVHCIVDFRRQGSVGTFSQGTGVINSAQDFRDVCATGSRVHIVNDINWCGGPRLNIIGCANTPGSCMVVIRFTDDQEGILWAHEFGHNKGLSHRDGDNAVMAPSIGRSHRRVNDTEKVAYETAPLETFAALQGSPQPGDAKEKQLDGAQPAGEARANPEDVAEFVRRTYIHGIPFEAVKAYSAKDLPRLFAMLGDQKEKAYWANIVGTICMIGDASATDRLIAFFQRGEGRLTPEEYRAKKTVVTGFGYIANQSEDKKALNFLAAGLKPDNWSEKGVKWQSPFEPSPDKTRVQLSTLAVLGLAISGKPEAAAALNSVAVPSTDPKFQPQISPLVTEALKMHNQVAREGLSKALSNPQ